MEIQVSGQELAASKPLKKYIFDRVPVTLEHKLVDSRDRHEELLHWQDEVELIRIRQGNIHCHVNDSDFLLSPGELCFINYEQLHRVYNTEPTACDMDVLTIKTSIVSRNAAVYERYIQPIISNKDFAHVQMDGRNGYARMISDIYDILYELIVEKPDGYELDVIGYIYLLFRRLYLVYTAQDAMPEPVSSDISLQRRMSEFIYENYARKISLDEIAAAAGVNRSKCAALFKKYTQMTPIAFLNSYRLDNGSRLLANTELPVSQIAQDCGFEEQSYFNRMFAREFGCTPLEWRNKKRKISA